jgi:outer membrane lipoprotein carrier protein
MKNILLSMITCFAVSLSSTGYGANQNTDDNQTSNDIKQEVSAKNQLRQILQGFSSFSAQFEQEVVDIEGEVLQNATGKLLLKQPNKLFWEVYEPDENLLIADGQNLWHVDPFVEQVVVVEQQSATQNNPIVLLTQQSQAQWEGFEVTLEGANFVVSPTDPDGQIAKLELHFEQTQLIGLTIYDRQQQKSVIQFSDIQSNLSLPDSIFEFSLPDGFILDDQR